MEEQKLQQQQCVTFRGLKTYLKSAVCWGEELHDGTVNPISSVLFLLAMMAALACSG